MPNLDGTGPDGLGPKTGAERGNCSDTKPKTRPLDGREEGLGKGQKARRQPKQGLRRGLGRR
jgi:hypothetical protein